MIFLQVTNDRFYSSPLPKSLSLLLFFVIRLTFASGCRINILFVQFLYCPRYPRSATAIFGRSPAFRRMDTLYFGPDWLPVYLHHRGFPQSQFIPTMTPLFCISGYRNPHPNYFCAASLSLYTTPGSCKLYLLFWMTFCANTCSNRFKPGAVVCKGLPSNFLSKSRTNRPAIVLSFRLAFLAASDGGMPPLCSFIRNPLPQNGTTVF